MVWWVGERGDPRMIEILNDEKREGIDDVCIYVREL